jgi:hypothetical protein
MPPRERLFSWRATLIKETPAKYPGSVDAPDEETARERAAKEFNVSCSRTGWRSGGRADKCFAFLL